MVQRAFFTSLRFRFLFSELPLPFCKRCVRCVSVCLTQFWFYFCSNSSGCKPIFIGLEVHSSSLSRVRCRRCCRQYQQRLFLPLLLLLLLLLLPLWLECPTLSPALLYHQHQHDWALFTLFAFFFFLLLLYLFSWPVFILPVCNCGGLHLACLTWTAISGPGEYSTDNTTHTDRQIRCLVTPPSLSSTAAASGHCRADFKLPAVV